jgi:gas vesicle protein
MRRLARPRALLVLALAVAGAAAAFFLDPASGRRRRHESRDRGARLARRGGHRASRFARHTSSEIAGRGKRALHAARRSVPDLDDTTLAHKVETILFRDRDVPKGQINVNAENGVVFLRGQVERPELVEDLEARVRKVRGVRDVANLLHVPGSPPPSR